MRDSEIVAAIVAGDPDGLAAAYDRYADPLYIYCRSMLSLPADAADAVQDTFVIAASRLAGLRDPGLLRAWLYSVARNECLRILRSGKPASALDEAPDVTYEVADVSEGAERDELRMLFEAASEGLNPGEREVIELQLRQNLEPAEVAAVLGVPRHRAHSLLSRARDRLDAGLGVLLIDSTGRGDCRELSDILTGWDGRLTVLLRKRAHRHIEHCPTCTSRRAFELRPANLCGLSAGAALAAGAAESFRAAAAAPAGLRGYALALAGGQGPAAAGHRAAVLARAGSFDGHGFPKPLHHPDAKAGLRSSPQRQAAAAVVLATLAAALAFALTGSTDHVTLSGGKPSAPAPSATGPGNPGATPALSPSATAVASLSPKPTAPTASSSATTSPAPTLTPTPVPGTLSVSGGLSGNRLHIPPGGTWISLVASGGQVDWSITVSGDPGNHITASPSSGTLANGASVQVQVTSDQQVSGATLVVNPGGTVYTVEIVGSHG